MGQKTKKKSQTYRNFTVAGGASSVLEASAVGTEDSGAEVGSIGLASAGVVAASVEDITKLR
jgi:hypothetical protein